MTKSHRMPAALPALGTFASLAAFASSGLRTQLAFGYIEGARALWTPPQLSAEQTMVLSGHHFSNYAMAID